MIEIIRTTPDNPEFIQLIALLDKDIQHRDGDEHVFYAQFNKTDTIKNAIVIYHEKIAVGCGAFKFYKEDVAEIKRMYVDPKIRGKGIASQILTELESWAREENYKSCILETGQKYPEAVALYKKNGFVIIENYGQYENNEDSICFQKTL
ncbi:Acetyltransferase (GNAT) family protein [Flavobacterium gillisiae]|uniref:Acetyltransferase (GNAT) family protein n=1 Tax=Flavobacterium gillisiae TaxID=150146 RepID=A0A1H4FMQ0_9FLAO|nr:GNAT family N-acetyltransferase [Flavobacterium gillisiae]SEA98100.1 Acetyltransferase (GNAT) family protein [Flavobacterium gillisiae]